MLEVLGICGLLLSWLFIAAVNKQHREETGVNMPSRGAMKAMRRRARKKGISEAQYYNEWVARKQKREGSVPRKKTPSKNKTSASTLPELQKIHPDDFPQLMMIAKLYGFRIRTHERQYVLVWRGTTSAQNPYQSELSTTFTADELRAYLHSL